MADHTLLAVFFVLAGLGLLDAGYLVWSHFRRTPLLCPLDHDCSAVTESRFASIFGVRNDVLGLLFFTAMTAVGLLALALPEAAGRLFRFAFFMSAGGTIFSFFLVGVQSLVLKNYCLYCLFSTLFTLLLCVTSFALAF